MLDKVLQSRTFLVGNAVTLADIILCCILAPGMKNVFDPAFRAPFPSLCRYFETVANQPAVVKVMGPYTLCEKAMVYTGAPTAPPLHERSHPQQPPQSPPQPPSPLRRSQRLRPRRLTMTRRTVQMVWRLRSRRRIR